MKTALVAIAIAICPFQGAGQERADGKLGPNVKVWDGTTCMSGKQSAGR